MPNDTPREKDDLQRAFDDAADGLGLSLESAPDASATRTIGLLFLGDEKQAVTSMSLIAKPPTVGKSDDDALRSLVNTWESIHPEDAPAEYRKYATDPYISVGNFTAIIDEKQIKQWLASDHYQTLKSNFAKPRNVSVTDHRIAYMGNTKAVVTYSLEETAAQSTSSGNGAVIAVKQAEGWRIAVWTKNT